MNYHVIKYFFITLLVFTNFQSSFATTNKNNSITTEQVREMALRFCGQVNALSADSLFPSLGPSIPIRFFTDSFTEVYTKFDLSYPYEADLFFNKYPEIFEDALDDCWPDSPSYQKAVYYTTKAAVIEAKALGIIGQIGLVKGAAKILYSIGKKSQSLANKVGISFMTLFGATVYNVKYNKEDDEKEIERVGDLIKEKLDERILILQNEISVCEKKCDELHQALQILQDLKTETVAP